MPTKVIRMELDGISKKFTVPDQPAPLELDICFNELKKAWQQRQKKQQKNALHTDQSKRAFSIMPSRARLCKNYNLLRFGLQCQIYGGFDE